MRTSKLTWTIIRTALFVVIGLFNTALIRPEDIGTWKNYAGYGFLLMALVDGVALVRYLARTRGTK
ncbi:MAG TPA: hypothetical protein PKE06_02060 [Flavilitoribacter sp.]|nr:hypothetical protein [Flavilitoribacter sp.]HMQ88670.1 hypothetical protein [Flavilitoribacter sp.]